MYILTTPTELFYFPLWLCAFSFPIEILEPLYWSSQSWVGIDKLPRCIFVFLLLSDSVDYRIKAKNNLCMIVKTLCDMALARAPVKSNYWVTFCFLSLFMPFTCGFLCICFSHSPVCLVNACLSLPHASGPMVAASSLSLILIIATRHFPLT